MSLGSDDLVAITTTAAALQRGHLLRGHRHVFRDLRSNQRDRLLFLVGVNLATENRHGHQCADHRDVHNHRRCAGDLAVVVGTPDASNSNRARGQFQWGKLFRKEYVAKVLFERLKKRTLRFDTEIRNIRGSRSAYWIHPVFSGDRKSTRLNSSHVEISYAVFCLKKKKKK